ncbi:hypothetical protein GKE82_23655 [Conexibacter sp. W3-3-2]|uniref:hypothetical protein n=1 Tax=Conexibacter sp. W3-3-2 TaxID=2675227 RepID=UPI0012B83777|nr:hypothetical protein [Conexibacter sp. W3-3-2]MTD47202.1 hypothetical protein [Conexibacter sp. W3-3-2]
MSAPTPGRAVTSRTVAQALAARLHGARRDAREAACRAITRSPEDLRALVPKPTTTPQGAAPMANYYGIARTNYVRVTDADALTRALEPFDVKLVRRPDAPDTVAILDDSDGGGWPSVAYDSFDENDEELEFDLVALVAPFLLDGEVMVAMESGHEKHRYVSGWALAFNNRGETKSVSLEDVYALASELGSTVTRASY